MDDPPRNDTFTLLRVRNDRSNCSVTLTTATKGDGVYVKLCVRNVCSRIYSGGAFSPNCKAREPTRMH